ncbi:MAG: serine/threonine protein kinase [Deltaproteobacteria bacterium]|nr:serine/threonine protein kinase [Deltaproteobacteria bacterium]
MLLTCPVCQRSFEEAGFCPYDRSPLVDAATKPTQLSMAMPSQPGSISAQQSAAKPRRTDVDPRRTFPLTPGPHAAQTQEITSTVVRAAPPAAADSIRAVSASENPQEVLAGLRAARDNVYDRLVGQTLDGRYYVDKKIGEGGMGVVFSARHAVIERPLAIKVLKREVMRDTATIRRFEQEARAASRIGHPNIVDVTDFGVTPDGMTYTVMEFIAGATLGQTIRASAPFPAQRAVRIAAQIARALGAAHDKGIVHRDLKPENVFLLDRDGRIDFVKIVDFGIAKVAPVEGQQAGPRLTRAGSVFGTPEYMAPEQAAGRGDTDGRADIYALGVILYEMLCARVPHKGDTMVRTLAMQMLDPVEPPSKVRPDANIPAELEAVVLLALAKKREHRYQTMGALLAALDKVQKDALPAPVAVSVTGSPVYALSPLPPGADEHIQTAQPPVPLSSGTGPDQRTIIAIATPATLPRRAHSPTSNPKNEPQFVTNEKPITFEHLYADEQAPPPRRMWPLLLAGAIVMGGAAGAIALVLQKRNAQQASTEVRDAGLARDAAMVAQLPADAALEADATPMVMDAGDLVILADAGTRIRVVPDRPARDAGTRTGPVLIPETPNKRGTIIVEVITKPETATLYVGTSYRGPNGTKLEEPYGTKLDVRCQQTGYLPGFVSIVFDGSQDAVLCQLKRIKTCIGPRDGVGEIKNPFDDCPDAGTPNP